MATKQHTFEGWADGDTLTTAGSGSGDVLGKVSTGANSTLTARTAAAVNGGRGGRAAVTSSNVACYVGYAFNAGAVTTTTYAEVEFVIPGGGYPATVIVLRGMDTTDATQRWRVSISTAGAISFVNSANGVLNTSSGTYNGQSVRVKVGAEGLASAAWSMKIYATPNSSTPTESLSGTAANLGGVIQFVRCGVAAASGTNITVDFDDFAVSDTDDLGPAAIAPTGIGSTATLGSLSLTNAGLAVAPTGVAASVALGALSLVDGSRTIAPTGISKSVSLGSPSLTDGSLSVSPTGIGRSVSLGSLGLADGSLAVTPTGIGRTVTLGTLALTNAALAVGPTGIGVAANLGAPALSQSLALIPAGCGLTATLGAVSVAFVADSGGTVTRPDTGIITRPTSGTVTRPDTGLVTRP